MNVLIIAPHPDDEILGVGGTIAKHSDRGDKVFVCIVTKGFAPLFVPEFVERTRSECRKADKILGVQETVFLDFPAVMLEQTPRHELNGTLLKVVQEYKPDIVYLPYRGDMQLDHKMIVDASMVALRPKYEHRIKKILCYETMSETGWDVPNCTNEFIATAYTDISDFLDKKIEALKLFTAQIQEFPAARSVDAVKALAIYRGSMMNMKAAEAFFIVRDIWT